MAVATRALRPQRDEDTLLASVALLQDMAKASGSLRVPRTARSWDPGTARDYHAETLAPGVSVTQARSLQAKGSLGLSSCKEKKLSHPGSCFEFSVLSSPLPPS